MIQSNKIFSINVVDLDPDPDMLNPVEYFGYRGLKREKKIEIKRVEITGEFRLKRFKYIYRVVQKKVY